jgi:hypothetical protein
MAATSLEKTISGSVAAVAATASATAAPSSTTDGFDTARFPRVRTLMAYVGTVSACNIQAWFRDRATGVWYRGAATDDFDALDPGGATPVNESRDWEVGRKQEVLFQVGSVSGGGTVAVKLQPIDTGARW